MSSFVVGQRINHPEYGECTVTFVGEKRLGVVFDDGTDTMFMLQDFEACDTVDTEAASPASRPVDWPDSTFVPESGEDRHSMGSHWVPFFDGPAELAMRLRNEILPESRPACGFGEFYPAPRQEPDSWVKGEHRFWPLPRRGLLMTLRNGPGAVELVSLIPNVGEGIQVTLRLIEVSVWASGVESQIHAAWLPAGNGSSGEAQGDDSEAGTPGPTAGFPICFFDTRFLVNRAWYETGEQYEFILAGIAYHARAATLMTLPYSPDPDQVAWERLLAEKRGEPPPEIPDTIHFQGMAMFLALPEGDDDDYSFRGPARRVTPFDDMLGQKGWRIRVTVMRFDDEDADLDIFVTERAWEGKEPPREGQDIEGVLWLQGELWAAGDMARKAEAGR